MYKYAVIGRNFIVDWFLEAAAEIPEVSLHGVYSRSKTAAEEFALKKGAKKAYSSLEEICGDSEIDFVYIASPNACHKHQAITLLSAGKHVLCEKPAVISSSEFDDVIAACGNNIFMEGMVPLHMPGYKKICELIPLIGTVRNIDFNFCQYSSRYDRYKNGIMTNTFDKTLGNGALMDLGIYCVEMLISLFSMPDEICGSAIFSGIEKSGIDTVDSIVCKYSDMLAKINVSKISDSVLPSQIQGEKGCILIDKLSRPKIITFCPKGGEKIVYDMSPQKHDMSYEIKTFTDMLDGKKNPFYNNITAKALSFTDEVRKKLGINF